MKFKQSAPALLMIRPSTFGFNTFTAETNEFQKKPMIASDARRSALQEFQTMVDVLRAHEIDVSVFDDTATPEKPDAVFPNNWISFHEDGTVVLYPMMAENRRLERRPDIIESLKKKFIVREIIDLTTHELHGQFLEGTGSIVFDRTHKIAYASRSPRTSELLVQELCRHLKYHAVVFDSFDEKHQPIYHTNVVMSVGEKFAVLCLDAIPGEDDQRVLLESFAETGHKVIAISYEQMKAFAGNLLEVSTATNDPVTLISQLAFQGLLPGQLNAMSQFAKLLPISIPTIETCGGGSVRCMVAGIHLPRQNTV